MNIQKRIPNRNAINRVEQNWIKRKLNELIRRLPKTYLHIGSRNNTRSRIPKSIYNLAIKLEMSVSIKPGGASRVPPQG